MFSYGELHISSASQPSLLHIYVCKAAHVIPSSSTCTTRVVPGLLVSNHLSFHKLIGTVEWSPSELVAAQAVMKFCAIPKWHHIPEHWNLRQHCQAEIWSSTMIGQSKTSCATAQPT